MLVQNFFVYGTLRQGGLFAHYWPCTPLRIQDATVQAALYDLGPYPAIVPGEDRVQGECWTIPERCVAETLRVLDALEEVDQGLYRREIVPCQTPVGSASAYAYFFARPESLAAQQRIRPHLPQAPVCWMPHER